MKESKLGKVNVGFDTFMLKDVFTKNDAGEWGGEPDENAIGVIRSTNFNNNGILDLSDVAYRTLKPSKKKEKLLEINDILIERSGGSDTQPVGRVGLITKEILKEEFVFANFIQRVAVDESINSTYLYYCLQQMYEMGITTCMQNQTTGIRNLNWKLYSRTVLPKPPKPEQAAIASVLSKVDKVIENVQNSIKAAEKLKKALMQNLLTGKMKPDGSFRTEEEFYIDEKYGKVPVGWSVKAAGDKSICYINPNYEFTKGNSYNFIPMDGINDSFRGVSYFDTCKIENGGYTRFKLGDILFAKITPCTENGKIAIIEKMTTEVGFASTEFIVFQPKDIIDNLFYYYILSSERVHRLAISLMEGTTGRQRVPSKIFRNRIFVAMPNDIQEQKNIAQKIKSIEHINTVKQTKIKTLDRLKKSLMQNLLTGKKRLSQEIINTLTQEIKNI